MNVKKLALAAFRAKRNGNVRPGWSRERIRLANTWGQVEEIGPITAKMLKCRTMAEFAGPEHALHFEGVHDIQFHEPP